MRTVLIPSVGWSHDHVGALKYCFLCIAKCAKYMSKKAKPNQIIGEIRSHMITSWAFAQCGMSPAPAGINMRAILTPRIDPMSA